MALPEPFTVASAGLLGNDPFTTFADGWLLGDADLTLEVPPPPVVFDRIFVGAVDFTITAFGSQPVAVDAAAMTLRPIAAADVRVGNADDHATVPGSAGRLSIEAPNALIAKPGTVLKA